MSASHTHPLIVTAKISVEIENASHWGDLLRKSLLEAFSAVPSPTCVAAIPPPSSSPPRAEPPQPKPSPPQVKPTPKQTVPDEHLLLDTKQVAELLGIGERTLWRWSRSGIAPRPIKIGRAVRWSADVVREWVADGCPHERERDRPRKGRS